MSDALKPLAAQVAVVTGAGRGIGRAIALAYARAGARIVCSARSQVEIEETATLIRNEGGQASAFVADVTDLTAVTALFEHAAAQYNGIDIVVGNAGIGGQARKVADSDPARWAQTIQINLIGAYHTAHAAIPHLRVRGAGKIIFVGSGTRHGANPGMSPYVCSKAALWKLTQILGLELAEFNISVNELIPGPVKTAMTGFGKQQFPAGEWAKEPNDLIPLAMFLATQPPIGPTAQSFSLMRRAGH